MGSGGACSAACIFVIQLRILERFAFQNYNIIRNEEKGVSTMKILLKILCAPVTAVFICFRLVDGKAGSDIPL